MGRGRHQVLMAMISVGGGAVVTLWWSGGGDMQHAEVGTDEWARLRVGEYDQ